MSFHERTSLAARGKWKGILLQLGVPAESLTGKHAPCPMCGGEDRFRFDNKEQRGTFICNACGAGDGMKLAVEFTGKPFSHVASQIDAMLGNVKPDAPGKAAISDEDRTKALRAVWSATSPMQPRDLARVYLTTRRIEELVYPKALRFGPQIRDGEGGIRPAMVAIVTDYDGKPVTLHRTFLKPDGSGKAEMTSPRKLMPGDLPDGSAVRLSEFTTGTIGIAAAGGIEHCFCFNAGNVETLTAGMDSRTFRSARDDERLDLSRQRFHGLAGFFLHHLRFIVVHCQIVGHAEEVH